MHQHLQPTTAHHGRPLFLFCSMPFLPERHVAGRHNSKAWRTLSEGAAGIKICHACLKVDSGARRRSQVQANTTVP